MFTEFEPYKETKEGDYYLLKNVSDKNKLAIIKIENDSPSLLYNYSLDKESDEVTQHTWENLSNPKKQIENFLFKNLSIQDISSLENCFDESDEDLENKIVIIDNYEE